MDGDKFVSTYKIPDEKINDLDDKNFFVNSSNSSINISLPEPLKHINDYDSNILQNDAYKEVNDDVFKLEYKIAKIEDEIKDLTEQIQSAKEIYDYYTADKLTARKKQLEEELYSLSLAYKETSVSAKISGNVISVIKEKYISLKNKLLNLLELIILKFPSKFSSVLEIRSSLQKLENINKSVDELIKREYNYMEMGDKYEQLSKYIVRANSIQAQISKLSSRNNFNNSHTRR